MSTTATALFLFIMSGELEPKEGIVEGEDYAGSDWRLSLNFRGGRPW